LIAVVVGSGTFVTQKFYMRDSIRSAGLVTSLLVTVSLLRWTNVGLWAVAIGSLANSLLQLYGFSWTFKRLLPEISFSFSLLQRSRIKEIFIFCVGSMLAFGGGYFVRAGVLWAVKNTSTSERLGEYAIAYQVGTMLATSIGSLLMVSSPAIYRLLSQGKKREACHQIESYNYLGVFWALTFLVFIWLDGESVLRLWLGNRAVDTHVIHPIMISLCVSAMLASLASPMGTFLVGCNQIMNCGIITLVEGMLVACSAYVFIRFMHGSLVVTALLPGVYSVVKQFLIYYVFYRDLFLFSSWRVWLQKALFLLVYGLILYILNMFSRYVFWGSDVISVVLRAFIAMIPIVPILRHRLNRTSIA
jgi:O-antigen/teichoic acid export membrane protein